MPTFPVFPDYLSTAWYPWATAMDTSARSVNPRLLSARFRPALQQLAAVPASGLPTVSWSASSSLSKLVSPLSAGEMTLLGKPGVWDDANFKYALSGAYIGVDFILNGTNLEFGFVEQVANSSRIWVFVDGAPITATDGLGITTSAGNEYWMKLVFGSAGRRRITIHLDNANALRGLRTDFTGSVTAAAPLPKVAFVGDSFFDGSAGAAKLQAVAFGIARLLDVNPFMGGVGGTGYVTGTTFGDSGRTSAVIAANPDLIVVMGSVNDDGGSGIQAAATSLFTTYRTSLPGVPVVVFGPQPNAASGTLSTNRATNNAAVRAAALASSNVAAFYDMVGNAATGTVPAAFATGAAWTTNQLTSYNGSIYRYVVGAQSNMASLTPDSSAHWIPLTYAYTGTGQVGSTTGNGSRDVLLYSDGTHPTTAGALALADRAAGDIRRALTAL